MPLGSVSKTQVLDTAGLCRKHEFSTHSSVSPKLIGASTSTV